MNIKKYQTPIEKFILPVILFLYPFIGVNQGVDVTDTTYSLGNYVNQDSLGMMWRLATYIPNLIGAFLSRLPGGGCLLGMNIYATFFISVTALFVYRFLKRFMPGWMIFIGEFIAISLCWCPRVILYNYLTYMFFTFGAMTLIYALVSESKKRRLLVLAGFFLGLNVMVRFPNAAECALILVVWFYGYITHKDIKTVVNETLWCILGFAAGILIPMITIVIQYGAGSYIGMLTQLFGMTGSASDYTLMGMLSSVISAYWHTISEMLILIPCIVAGTLMFYFKRDKYIMIKKSVFLLGILLLIKFYFSEGIITTNYYYYDSMFELTMMTLIIAIIMFVIIITGVIKSATSEERLLSAAALIIILITPLGSNNYTFPLVNNLFMVMPIFLWMLRRIIASIGGDKLIHYSWEIITCAIIILLVIQGALFHSCYSFVDGADGTKRNSEVSGVAKAKYMITTDMNASELSQLYSYLEDNDLLGKELITFGNIPGISYLFDMEPAIFSTWPDLDSNTVESFDDALMDISTRDEQPLIIVHDDIEGEVLGQEKYDILLDYIANHDYNKIFNNESYTVYLAE